MTKLKLIFVLLFFYSICNSQDFLVGIYYQPGVSNRFNTEKLDGLTYEPRYSYASGIDIDYKLISNFWLNSGISISNRSYTSYSRGEIMGGGGFYFKTVNSSYSVTIPLRLIYMINFNEKVDFGINIGLSYNYRFKALTYNSGDINGVKIDTITNDYKKQHRIYGLFGFDLRYHLTDLVCIFIQPNFDLETYLIDSPWKSKVLWRNFDVGIKIGINYKL